MVQKILIPIGKYPKFRIIASIPIKFVRPKKYDSYTKPSNKTFYNILPEHPSSCHFPL